MAQSESNQEKRRIKFNLIDAVIVLLLLAVIAATVFIFFFSDASFMQRASERSGMCTLRVTFVMEPVDNDFLSDGHIPMMAKDAFYLLREDEDTAFLGEIETVGTPQTYLAATGYADDNGTMAYAEQPGMSRIDFTVLIQAERLPDGGYRAAEIDLGVGLSARFSTPYFSGECRCITMEEVSEK